MNSLSADQMKALEELVQNIKKGGKYDKDYIQVGGHSMLLLTFFDQVINSLAKDLPMDIKKDELIAKLSRKFPKLADDRRKHSRNLAAGRWADRPNEFRSLMQKHISNLPPQFQLKELNKIQRDCPFSLVDPKGKKLTTKKMKYGYADLYRFLGFPYSDGIVRSDMGGQNPFYHPINMPIPDVYANNTLSHIRRFSPSRKLMEAKEIQKQLMSQGGGAFLVSPKPAVMMPSKVLDEGYKKKVERMADLIFDVANRVYSPVTLSHFVAGQERPMKKYLDKNFNTMLWELNKVHLIKPISNIPNVTSYSVESSAMKQAKGRGRK